ncbi:EF-hand calcium-binding domain-containing protein 8 isoform X1 [Ochotona princeps]|uniref:EF-hand calcium-binding domain-containing protein 8 isoform X1 n=1 Tax=Ochotona princeps TaxID=9978 RepID=UPI002715332E|nr:EF-hand calcium-binding domain-containing protein 8 isoform X1 [Ochotona princeps]
MAQMKQGSKAGSFGSSSIVNWADQIGSRSQVLSSVDIQGSLESRKSDWFQSSTLHIFEEEKEAPGSLTSSVTFNPVPEAQHGSHLFAEMPLAKVEKIFEAGLNKAGVMDLEAFIKTMRKVLSSASNDMLEALFMKVDTDCNGFVTWQKYVDYMMREFRGQEEMRKSQYRLRFHLPMTVIPLNHGCEIVKVEFLKLRFKKIGCFLTVSKDGLLQFWTETFSLINSFKLNKIQPSHNQQMWVIDMVCLHNMNLLAVASTELKIEFFDISNHQCVRAFTFIDVDSCVLVMHYWSDYHRGVFCYGDAKGNIIVFTSDNMTHGLFNPHILPRASKWDHWTNISMQKLLNEKSTLHRSYHLRAVHPNWCQQIKFIPQLNVVVSCSAIDRSSLVLSVLPTKASEKPRLSVLNLRKGILCFDYCPDKNFLVTGGYDPDICLWNPFMSKKPVWLMKGHRTAVTHIMVGSKNSSILISISKDKNVRIWDMQDYVCLQSFCGKLFALGNCPITSAYFHSEAGALICTTFSVGILKGYLEAQGPVKSGKITTHGAPLCAVLYSKTFRQVVSGCLYGTVYVWEVTTGRRIVEFSVHGAQQVELTAMALDESERCLLTGLRDGTMKMWNYSTGECLLTFPNPDQLEISGIVHMNKAYYITGWSKRITNFMFHKTKHMILYSQWQTFHKEDVLSLAKYQNQFLGTSSYSGDILFWNTNMYKPIFNFNASKSPLPLQPKKVQEVDSCLSEDHRTDASCAEQKVWVHKAPRKLTGPGTKTVTSAGLRRNLMSAPPVMRHWKEKEREKAIFQQASFSAGRMRVTSTLRGKQFLYKEAEKKRGEFQKKKLLQSNASVEKIIFLQTRPRLPHTAALLSSCMDGFIYAWSIHGNGGLLGKFPVDLKDHENIVVGAMATDENDWILITGDCKGSIKIWDIKDYCVFVGQAGMSGSVPEAENKFRVLIPKRLQISTPYYVPLKEKEVVMGQTISLVPPKLLITWRGHVDSVTDILYVDSFQLVISAGQDRNVKAWKLSGDAIGTFGLSLWKRLQDATLDGDQEQGTAPEVRADSVAAVSKSPHPELQDLAEVLGYQRREQVVLMDLLSAREDAEMEAWAKLRRICLTSPWTEERSPSDIEDSWNQWESKGRQVSKVLGAAYKPKGQLRGTRRLTTIVPFSWMKHQISPQVYQSLHCSELVAVQQPDFLRHRALGHHGRHIRWVVHDIPRDLDTARVQPLLETMTSMTIATSPSSSSLSSPPSRLVCGSLQSQSSASLPRPWSATIAQATAWSPRDQRQPCPLLFPCGDAQGVCKPPLCPL